MFKPKRIKLGLVVLAVLVFGHSEFSALADEPAYLQDQRIDEEMGIWDRPWKPINLVNIYSRYDEPHQVRPGFPPYDQEVERAQNLSTRGTSQNCFFNQFQQLVCV